MREGYRVFLSAWISLAFWREGHLMAWYRFNALAICRGRQQSSLLAGPKKNAVELRFRSTHWMDGAGPKAIGHFKPAAWGSGLLKITTNYQAKTALTLAPPGVCATLFCTTWGKVPCGGPLTGIVVLWPFRYTAGMQACQDAVNRKSCFLGTPN